MNQPKANLQNEIITCLLLFFINIIIKLSFLCLKSVINKDGALYLLCAQLIHEDNWKKALDLFPYPLFPYLIALTYKIIPNWEVAGYLLSTFPAAFAIIPFYVFSRSAGYNKQTALWSSIFFICAPFPNEFSLWIGRDGLFWLITLISLVLFTRTLFHSYSLKFLSIGILLSFIAFTIRAEGIVLTGIGFLIGIVLIKKKYPVLLPIAIIFPILIITIIVLLPQDIKMHLRIDQLYTQLLSIYNLNFLANYKLIYNTLKKVQTQLPGASWAGNFMEVARHYMPVVYIISLIEGLVRVIFPLFVPFIIYGLLKSRGEQKGRRSSLWILALTAVFLIPPFMQLITYNYLSYRYVIIPAFLLFIFAGKGLLNLMEYIKTKNSQNYIILLYLLITLMFSSVLFYTARRIYSINTQSTIIPEAVKNMKSKGIPNSFKYLSNDPRISYYLNKKDSFIHTMDVNPSLLEEIASQEKAQYIILTLPNKRVEDVMKGFKHYIINEKFTGEKITILVASKLDSNIRVFQNTSK